jgi:hypothetical protein
VQPVPSPFKPRSKYEFMGCYYRADETLMRHWRDVLPSGEMLDVQYEEVLDDLEGRARHLVWRGYCSVGGYCSCLTCVDMVLGWNNGL